MWSAPCSPSPPWTSFSPSSTTSPSAGQRACWPSPLAALVADERADGACLDEARNEEGEEGEEGSAPELHAAAEENEDEAPEQEKGEADEQEKDEAEKDEAAEQEKDEAAE
jgi:hypothetical protein